MEPVFAVSFDFETPISGVEGHGGVVHPQNIIIMKRIEGGLKLAKCYAIVDIGTANKLCDGLIPADPFLV
jgi:hypothetical protein